MVFPGLPTDKISKVFFFGGLIMMIATFVSIDHYSISTGEVKDKKGREIVSARYNNFRLQNKIAFNQKILNKSINKDSSELIKYRIAIDSLFLLEGKELLHKLDLDIKYLDNNYFISDDVALVFFFIGSFILIIGVFLWVSDENESEKRSRDEYNKTTKQIPCESCGVMLNMDFRPFIEERLCSTCYDGKNYKEPNLTRVEMEERVSRRLKELGNSDKEIKKNVSRIKKLDRWSKQLKW